MPPAPRPPLPPPPTRLSLFSPAVSRAIEPAHLRALLVSRFAPELAKLVTNDPAATSRALWGLRVPLYLAQGFDAIERLGTEAGLAALVEAAGDVHVDCRGWEDEHPANVAARLVADAIQQNIVLWRAHLRLLRLPPERATYERRALEGKRVPASAGGAGRTRALAAALRKVAGAADAWVHVDDETGDVHAVVLHDAAGPTRSAGRATRPAAPAVRADALRLFVPEGRLAITPSRPQLVGAYAEAFGAALYDDPRFFLAAPSVTLKPLQELLSAGLAAATEHGKLLGEVPRVRVVACRLEAGEGYRDETEGPDALARIARQLRDGGHLTRATLRVDVAGEQEPVDCVIQPPHRIDVGWGGVARAGARPVRIAREIVAKLGLLSPGAIADDITTLRPFVQPEWRWQQLVGLQGWGAMCVANLLTEVEGKITRRASSETYRGLGPGAVAYPLFVPVTPRPGGKGAVDPDAPAVEKDLVRAVEEANAAMVELTRYYVVPEDFAQAAVSVPQKEMAMQRLDLLALLRKVRAEMGLSRGRRPSLPKGVLWVGEMPVEGGVVRFFYLVRAAADDKDRAALGRAITRAASFARAVVFVPKGRKLGRDFVEIELTVREQLGADSWRGKVADAVRELRIEDKVAPERLVCEDARLVVDAKRERVLLDGVELGKLGQTGYVLIKVLVEQQSKGVLAVKTRETDQAIRGTRGSEGGTRYTSRKVKKWIAESFAAAGREVPLDVKEDGLMKFVRGCGWMLTVKGIIA